MARKAALTSMFENAQSDDDEGELRDAKRARLEVRGVIEVENPSAHAAFEFRPDAAVPAADATPRPTLPQRGAHGVELRASEFYRAYVARTEAECKAEAEAPQRSGAWLAARQFCLTASDFGAACGSNPFCSPTELVKRKLWDTFRGNAATEWGAAHEDHAAEAFLAWARRTIHPDAQLVHMNLIKWADMPWLGVSPDGVLVVPDASEPCGLRADLVEFKCPTRAADGHPYAKYPQCTPPYYKDQMLGIWGMVAAHGGMTLDVCGTPRHVPRLGSTWFVTWTPSKTYVVRHEFADHEFAAMLAKLHSWYFERYLPALTWYFNGRLEHGQAEPQSAPLEIEESKSGPPSPCHALSPLSGAAGGDAGGGAGDGRDGDE